MKVHTTIEYRDDDHETRYSLTYDPLDQYAVLTDIYLADPVPYGLTINEVIFLHDALADILQRFDLNPSQE